MNKTNCKLRFENITTNQNAYLLELAIYGLVDLSKTPALGKVTINGVDYQTADICEENADGDMCATVEISKKEQMVDETANPVVFGTPDNGEIKSIEYNKVDDNSTVVTVVVAAGDKTVTYKLTVAFKPDYTLTYYNTDGTVLEAVQQVEKDSPIANLRNGDGVIVTDGKAFRGWFVKSDGGRKYTTADIVTGPTSLYAVATDIEVTSDVNRYTYNLQIHISMQKTMKASVLQVELSTTSSMAGRSATAIRLISFLAVTLSSSLQAANIAVLLT